MIFYIRFYHPPCVASIPKLQLWNINVPDIIDFNTVKLLRLRCTGRVPVNDTPQMSLNVPWGYSIVLDFLTRF